MQKNSSSLFCVLVTQSIVVAYRDSRHIAKNLLCMILFCNSLLFFAIPGATQTVTLPDSICMPGASVTKVTGNLPFIFTEGPAVKENGDLFFTVPDDSKIWKIPASGVLPTSASILNTGVANGLTIDIDDRIVAAQQNKVSRFADDGTATILAQSNGTLQLKNCNDVTLGRRGQMYFTNWDGGNVFYRSPAGEVKAVVSGLGHSNGVFLIEEDSVLFVNDDAVRAMYKYRITADGSLSNRSLFAEVNVPDGMEIDMHKNVYVASYQDNCFYVFNSAGQKQGKIDLSAVAGKVTNCAFGGTDDKTFYMTASNGVYKVTLKIPGRRLSKLNTAVRSPAIMQSAAKQAYHFRYALENITVTYAPFPQSFFTFRIYDCRGIAVAEPNSVEKTAEGISVNWNGRSLTGGIVPNGWYVLGSKECSDNIPVLVKLIR